MTHCSCHGFISKKCPTARMKRRVKATVEAEVDSRATGLLTRAQREALNDLQTHHRAWRSALEHSLAVAGTEPPVDDSGYWKHEIAVLDRTVAALKSLDTL